MIEEYIQIICSRKIGASKKEIIETAKLFGFNIDRRIWNRFLYVQSKGKDIGLYSENKRWFSTNSNYYKTIVNFVNNNEKGITDAGMSLGIISSWIDNNHGIFVKTFNINEF